MPPLSYPLFRHPLVDAQGYMTHPWQQFFEGLVRHINAPVGTYLVTNVVTDRAYDANATTLAELADVVGTLLADLRARGQVA